MAGVVVVFDFDKTIIDCDSDNWVIDELGFTELFEELLPTMPWNTLMDRMMNELHANGKTIKDIEESLKTAPIDPNVITMIKAAYALGCDLRVVSDANQFFIETILRHHGLKDYFTEINTNPGYVDAEGRLRIFPYHDFHKSSHGCDLCPPNMCKSKILERIITSASADGKKRFIYLGDGKGDYCPSLHLSESDFVMPRKYYPMWELINSNPHMLKAEVHEWTYGEDQARKLLQLINKVAVNALLSAECKFETIPLSQNAGLTRLALRVPN
ncbi:Pyridoxal phosphate phosphatase-related protein [Rhynchospora pubera]|uniref:Pyridoxal phosphate phosphatase-related protein n=1 Tax=Rhynchospora pubera TaxID=906938 RepID=A0AAV8EIK8_9POAL|nr:Pyridoxal phosphate phosphatase-related protein [Rhynchospora pubera]KAJ4787478.1 Pyridoxal phosphate phosphatase-related protein [Rhynchospora pubera]KAJ4806884.1 Pyridoxal phosphate phosphatase-related protein [Rhynchospora pubera]